MTKFEKEVIPGAFVSFQGKHGAYSHMACRETLPNYTPLPCPTFDEAFSAVSEGRAARAMIPIENSTAGRVADIHHLMPRSDLFIIGEHYQRVNHMLMAPKGALLKEICEIHSHVHALGQCRNLFKKLDIHPTVHADTAGACQMVAEKNDPKIAAIGSSLASEIYGLEILKDNVQDLENNVTRFVILSNDRITPKQGEKPCMTSFVFQVKSVPSALYKSLGGFATTGVNITKIESYMEPGSFEQAQFYADIEGHPDQKNVKLAFEELQFFCTRFQILGTYPSSKFRKEN